MRPIAAPPGRPAQDRRQSQSHLATAADVIVVQIDQNLDGYSGEEKLARLAALLGPELESLFKRPATALGGNG